MQGPGANYGQTLIEQMVGSLYSLSLNSHSNCVRDVAWLSRWRPWWSTLVTDTGQLSNSLEKALCWGGMTGSPPR